ncbi:hypothetical protein SOCEGT47_071920 [Sorangium cellulosum]|uniref:Outer membrane protein beta-barrel domain-containing protein n=1 Tax=Sorangium cellulosum TaxID=56 RepID=A0A4V0NEL8_SORCE|nr:hypothetical protein [Sorangium cellulosum]AUX26622.1 hypothetical protein SOCEGT47_071920 [Sorangium cellulosum]
MKALPSLVSVALAGATLLALAPEAQANIKNPNDHPDYFAELEPHGNFVFWRRDYGLRNYRRYRDFGDPEFGVGFRATIELADPAFIPRLNNTVGISFGLDLTNCRYCYDDFTLWSPVTMQWNFFFTDQWSAFADLGVAIRSDGFYRDAWFDVIGMVGGRYHFNDDISLTMRIGYPFVSFGVSFFVG